MCAALSDCLILPNFRFDLTKLPNAPRGYFLEFAATVNLLAYSIQPPVRGGNHELSPADPPAKTHQVHP